MRIKALLIQWPVIPWNKYINKDYNKDQMVLMQPKLIQNICNKRLTNPIAE